MTTNTRQPNKWITALRQYADQMRDRPGAWAKYPGRYVNASTTLCALKNGNYSSNPTFPPEEFEFRRVGDEVHLRVRIMVDE